MVTDNSLFIENAIQNFRFPKEFRKDWIKQLDIRFLFIFIITAAFEIGLVIILMITIKSVTTSTDVQRIQKQYAHLLLERVTPTAMPGIKSPPEAKDLITRDIPNENEVAGAERFSDQSQRTEVELSTKNAPIHSRVPRSERSSDSFKSRAASSVLSRQVSQQGVLKYLIRAENSDINENLSKLFSNSEKNAAFLNESIDKMKIADLKNGTSESTSNSKIAGIKGSSIIASQQQQLASLQGISQISSNNIEKNAYMDLAAISTLTTNENTTDARSPEHVTKIMQSHNRSIQDCYRYATRRNPDLKGKIAVRIFVTINGIVDHVEIVESTIEDDQLLRCIVRRIERWRAFGECDPSIGTVSYRQSYVFGY